jgi:hypothetical protein
MYSGTLFISPPPGTFSGPTSTPAERFAIAPSLALEESIEIGGVLLMGPCTGPADDQAGVVTAAAVPSI